MKRIVPLWITAIVGLVLIISNFLPGTRSWGEEATTWFGIIAAVAFVLGGGSLLKVHLKKISDRNLRPGLLQSGLSLILVSGPRLTI